MVGEIIGGLSAMNALFSMAKGVKDLTDASERARVSIDLQQKILVVQRDLQQLVGANDDLKRQIATYDRWETEAARYFLKDFGSQTFAYELREAQASGDPVHLLCPKCYQDRRKSLLQFQTKNYRSQLEYKCPSCNIPIALGTPIDEDYSGRSSEGGWKAL